MHFLQRAIILLAWSHSLAKLFSSRLSVRGSLETCLIEPEVLVRSAR